MPGVFDELRGKLVRRFGEEGLRRIAVPEDVQLPPGVARLLTDCGVPRQVGAYFSTADEDPVRLDAWCGRAGGEVPEESAAAWCRIGWDGGAQLCVDASGAVRAAFVDLDEPGLEVNGSLAAFLESLLALDEGLSSLASADELPERAELTRALVRRIAVAELAPIEAADSWWLSVLQDLRHTMSYSSYAAFEVRDAQGDRQIISASGGLGLHAEERVWQDLRAAGVEPGRVLRIYTELETCFLPGHYCSVWLAELFPHAEFTHSHEYGGSVAEREEGFLELLRETAARPE